MALRKPIVSIAGVKQEIPAGDAVPAANGGTGLTDPGAVGNLLTSNGTAWVSSAAAGGASVANGKLYYLGTM